MYNLQRIILWVLGIAYVLLLQVAWFTDKLNLIDYVYALAPLMCVVFGLILLKQIGLRSSKFFSFLLLTLGLLSFFIAELIYIYFALIGSDPFPSIADVFFIAAPILMSGGIIREVMKDLVLVSKWRLLPFFLGAVAVLWYMISVVFDPSGTTLENTVYIGYVIGDGLLLLAALLALVSTFNLGKGRFGKVWFSFAMGALIYMIGDFLYLQFADVYEEQAIWAVMQMDVLWVSSYLFFASAFANMSHIIDDITGKLRV